MWIANMNGSNASDQDSLESLITALSSSDDSLRWEARHSLVALGSSIVAPLTQVLQGQNVRARWEAAKALGELRDPATVAALVGALADPENDVRWAAADGLIALGKDSLVPLLDALVHHSDSVHLRSSARHILRILQLRLGLKSTIVPVLDALDGVEPSLAVPIATREARDALSQ